jgi:hypothetical protein
MAVRTAVDIPEALHETLSERAKTMGTSIRALIVRAVEDAYRPRRGGTMITGPFIQAGKLGPEFPADENPHDLVLS